MARLDLVGDGVELGVDGAVDQVLVVLARHGAVGRDDLDGQLVDLAELGVLGKRGTGHAGELLVQTEVVLQGDGGQGLGLRPDIHPFFGFDCLMQTVAEAAAVHETTGKFVDNQDLTVLHDVVHIPFHQVVGTKCLIHIVVQLHVVRIREVLNIKVLLALRHTFIRQGNLVVLLVDLVIRILQQRLYKTVGGYVHSAGIHALSGNDQRRSGFIDEDGVHLVHDGEVMAPLHLLVLIDGHVVPQVVKAHLVVGAVGDVGVVGGLPLLLAEVVDDQAHRQAQKAVDLAHPLAVSLGQIVVDGDDVNATARQCIEVGGQRGHQRLTFTGLHLSDAALMQHDAADELHAERLHAQHTVRRLPHGGKGLRQQVVQRLAVGQTLLNSGVLA